MSSVKIVYKNFSVFGQIENLWMDKINSLEDIYIKFRETELVEIHNCLECEFTAHYAWRMQRWIWNLQLPTDSTFE